MYRAYLREMTFQTHTWYTGIFISYSIRDTVVCGEPTRYTATETAAGWLRGRCASGVSIVVKIIRGSERCRLPRVIGAFLRKKKTEIELFVKQVKSIGWVRNWNERKWNSLANTNREGRESAWIEKWERRRGKEKGKFTLSLPRSTWKFFPLTTIHFFKNLRGEFGVLLWWYSSADETVCSHNVFTR